MAKKFVFEKAPFIRRTDNGKITTNRIMNDVVIALIPLIIFAWVKNGLLPFLDKNANVTVYQMLYPLIFIICGGLFSILLEGLYFIFFKYYFPNKYAEKKVKWNLSTIIKELKNSHGVITGLILAMILPINTPLYVLLFGCFIGNIVFKMLYGGFGYNIFNPALIAYAVIIIAFWGVISANGGVLNSLEITTGASPLINFKNVDVISYETVIAPYGSIWSFILGFIPGALGETCGLLIILAFIYLLARKAITWIVPVFYVGTVFVISLIIMFINGYGIWYPLFQIFSGGLLFGAVFMATEPVTTPRSPNGKAIYGILLGLFTLLFRLFGSLPGGVGTSMLIVGLFSTSIDRFSAKLRMHRVNYRGTLGYLCLLIVFVLISAFIIIKAIEG